MKDPFKCHVWRIINLEGYCLIKCVIESKYIYSLEGEKKPNPNYNPDKKPPIPPDYCPGQPEFICLDNKCDFFGYCEHEPEEDVEK